MKSVTIADLALFAASECSMCRQGERPKYEYSQEQGAEVTHVTGLPNNRAVKCAARVIWILVHKLEQDPTR